MSLLRGLFTFRNLKDRAISVLLISAFVAASSCLQFSSRAVVEADGTGTYEAKYVWGDALLQKDLSDAVLRKLVFTQIMFAQDFDANSQSSDSRPRSPRTQVEIDAEVKQTTQGLILEGLTDVTVQIRDSNGVKVIRQRGRYPNIGKPYAGPFSDHYGPVRFFSTSDPDIVKVRPGGQLGTYTSMSTVPPEDESGMLSMWLDQHRQLENIGMTNYFMLSPLTFSFRVRLPGPVIDSRGYARDPKDPNVVIWKFGLRDLKRDGFVKKFGPAGRTWATFRRPANFAIPLQTETEADRRADAASQLANPESRPASRPDSRSEMK